MEKIKSKHLYINIFSYINEERKLKLVKYNKNIQKNIDINLLNYKVYKGYSFEGDKNGKGKVYDNYFDLLIFEGEYLNGKKNGKGKEYYNNGNLKYEGEYLNGKRMEKEKNIIMKVN